MKPIVLLDMVGIAVPPTDSMWIIKRHKIGSLRNQLGRPERNYNSRYVRMILYDFPTSSPTAVHCNISNFRISKKAGGFDRASHVANKADRLLSRSILAAKRYGARCKSSHDKSLLHMGF